MFCSANGKSIFVTTKRIRDPASRRKENLCPGEMIHLHSSGSGVPLFPTKTTTRNNKCKAFTKGFQYVLYCNNSLTTIENAREGVFPIESFSCAQLYIETN